MDLTNILVTAALALGIFAADAWMNADNINVQINMPRGYGASEISVGNHIAENVFLNEVSEILDVPTFVKRPEIRSADEATVVSLMAELLGLKDFTFVMQRAVGLDPIILNGSVTKRADRHTFVVVSNVDARNRISEVDVSVTQAEGEPITTLIRRGAVATMLIYEDYLAMLYLMDLASRESIAEYNPSLPAPGYVGIDALIQQKLATLPTGITAALRSEEVNDRRAMLINLRGMVALEQNLEENDVEPAANLFGEALDADPDYIIALLNLAFTRVHQDRYQDAIDLVRTVLDNRISDDPILVAAAHITWGVAAWGMEQHEVAANQFRHALENHAESTMANVYWGELLQALGDEQGAAQRFAAARENLPLFEGYAELAMLHLRLTHLDDTPLSRIGIHHRPTPRRTITE